MTIKELHEQLGSLVATGKGDLNVFITYDYPDPDEGSVIVDEVADNAQIVSMPQPGRNNGVAEILEEFHINGESVS